jgi:pimeloyl-ACP methyl ester carboxylesterase
MAEHKQKPARTKTWKTRLKLLLGALLLFALAITTLIYFRPVATMTIVQRGLLKLSGIESKFAQIGPYRIHYLIGGDGPTLLLLHGHPSRALEWGPLLHDLSQQHRVVAIDFLGYGESDAPDVDYSISRQSEVVVGLLDVLGLKQTDVLGFSMGGWVALKLAVDHPDRVSRLVIVDSGGLTFLTALTADSFVPQTLPQFREMESLHSDRQLPEFVARDLLRSAHERSWVYRRMGTSLLSFRDALDGRLSNVKIPVLVIWGKEDRLIPYEVALRFQRELPQARLVSLERCGHMVLWDCRERALPEVLAFLR